MTFLLYIELKGLRPSRVRAAWVCGLRRVPEAVALSLAKASAEVSWALKSGRAGREARVCEAERKTGTFLVVPVPD